MGLSKSLLDYKIKINNDLLMAYRINEISKLYFCEKFLDLHEIKLNFQQIEWWSNLKIETLNISNTNLDEIEKLCPNLDGMMEGNVLFSKESTIIDCTLEEIKYNVIKYAKPTDWIVKVDEEYLDSCIQRFYERNKILVEECQKYNQTLIDTKSKEERNIILNNLLNEIIK